MYTDMIGISHSTLNGIECFARGNRFSFSGGYLRDTFVSVCHLHSGIPFLLDKREALVGSFLCYLEESFAVLRVTQSINGVACCKLFQLFQMHTQKQMKPVNIYRFQF
jgi:hypothetical protein